MKMLILFNASKGLSTFWIPVNLTFQIAFFYEIKHFFICLRAKSSVFIHFAHFPRVDVLFIDIYKY